MSHAIFEVISNLSIAIIFYLSNDPIYHGKTIYHWKVHDLIHLPKIKNNVSGHFLT